MRRTLTIAITFVATTLLSGQGPTGALSRVCSDFTASPRTQVSACTNLLTIFPTETQYIQWQVLMLRAAAYLRGNETENAKLDYARALQFITKTNNLSSVATWYASVCWTYAVLNLELRQAMTDCNEGVRVGPTNGPALNSRGFVFLRLGRFAEAVADYDRALERPLSENLAFGFADNRAHLALFGRGIAKLRLGDSAGGNADIAAAEKMRPGVTTEFALYGIKP